MIVLSACGAFSQAEPSREDSNSALGALDILPPQYRGSVVKLSADNGTPDPPQWYVLAYRGDPDNGLFSIAIAKGEIVQEKPSLNLGNCLKPSVAVDELPFIGGRFRTALNSRPRTITLTPSLRLQTGRTLLRWKIWCYDREDLLWVPGNRGGQWNRDRLMACRS
jgi:hypothetical protein